MDDRKDLCARRTSRAIMLGGLLLACAACAPGGGAIRSDATTDAPARRSTANAATEASDKAWEQQQIALLQQAGDMIREHQAEQAIKGPLEALIRHYEDGPGKDGKRYYCATTGVETILYLAHEANEGRDAVVLNSTWADAYFLKGYALGELGRVADEQKELEKAIRLSPQNAHYLSEMGYTHQMLRQWKDAIETYEQAEAASEFSPDETKVSELTRALRGQAFALTETGKLDEAQALYERCLKLNPDDQNAKRELAYIKQLRSKMRQGGGG